MQGELARREVAAAFDQVLHRADFEPGMNTLWDLREARLHAMSGAEVRGIVAHAGRRREQRGRGRVAIVANRYIDFGMSRMFELFAARLLPTPVMVFRDIDDAKRSLTSRPNQRR